MLPEISLTDFRKLRAEEVKRLQSCVVTADGEYLFTFINPNTDFVKLKADNLALLSNSVGGETLEQIRSGELVAV